MRCRVPGARKARARRGARSKVFWKVPYIEGAQMHGVRAGSGRGPGVDPCSPPAGRETWAKAARALAGGVSIRQVSAV